MPEVVLLDTGPLVALLDEDEEYQAWATGRIRGLTPPLLTCEAVLTEACFLLKTSRAPVCKCASGFRAVSCDPSPWRKRRSSAPSR